MYAGGARTSARDASPKVLNALNRGHAAPDLNPQRETDRRFGAGQAAAPDGWDPSRRAAYSEIAGALEDFAMDSWQAL